MRCTKQTVEQIVDSGNDYLIAVKRNQPNLDQELNTQFEQAVEMDIDIQNDSSHGRQVQRSDACFDTDRRDRSTLGRS